MCFVVEGNSLYYLRLLLDPLVRVEYIQRPIVELSVPLNLKPAGCVHFHNILDYELIEFTCKSEGLIASCSQTH